MKYEDLSRILMYDCPSAFIRNNEDKIFSLIPELKLCKNFNQNNLWHIYDVYEHILHVVDNVPLNLELRLAALFHDVGKSFVYTEDEMGVGHFYDHWNKSNDIFLAFAKRNNLNSELISVVSKLIIYHDINFSKIDLDVEKRIIEEFSKDELNMLFELKRSDLLAQNSKFYYLFDEYERLKGNLLEKYYSDN